MQTQSTTPDSRIAPQAGRRRESFYASLIRETVPDCDPRHVEAYMRLDFGTLDGLTRDQFRYEAMAASHAVRADPVQAELLARSYGL